MGPVLDCGPLTSTKNGKFSATFLTLIWRWGQCGQQFWNLMAPLPWNPRCSPDVSRVAGALAEAALVLYLNAASRLEPMPQTLPEFPHVSAAPHQHSSAAPHALGTELCGHTTGVPCPYWLPGAADVTSISSSLRSQKNKNNQLNQEPGIRILVLIYGFIMAWVNSLN